jgi:hypothetical protein
MSDQGIRPLRLDRGLKQLAMCSALGSMATIRIGVLAGGRSAVPIRRSWRRAMGDGR